MCIRDSIVMHSVTKYIGGHSDVVMGALLTNNEQLYKDLFFIYNACGATPGPVSYTHLDVYKRQSTQRVLFARAY